MLGGQSVKVAEGVLLPRRGPALLWAEHRGPGWEPVLTAEVERGGRRPCGAFGPWRGRWP